MPTAVVIGSSGGIGSALVTTLLRSERFERVLALARKPQIPERLSPPEGRLEFGHIDLEDEASIQKAAEQAGEADLVLVATGALTTAESRPERSYRALSAESMIDMFRVNAVGPALVARSFLPLLPRNRRSVFAVLSARVGSISDNRLGGWHSYRASKAALNMLVRNLAIELTREKPEAVCVGLHPGTVETDLSAPFRGSVPKDRLFTPDYSATCMLAVLDQLTPADSGGLFAWDGQRIDP
jgi:NAD(P)-dependent dehydrogenase (short-subunit alcohol dehydrogenase family)